MIHLRLHIDNQYINVNDIENLQDATITYRKNDESGDIAVSFSSNLVLRGEAYKLIKSKIIDAVNPAIVSVTAKVYDTETNKLLLDGIIKGSEVEWSIIGKSTDQCTITIHDNSNDAKSTACLQNMIIWERMQKTDGTFTAGENTFRQAPYSVYFESGNHALLIIGIILKIALLPIYTIAIIASALSGKKSDLELWLERLQNAIVQKGKHKTPYIHSYLSNLCEACNLELQSEMFEPGGTYHNLMRLDASTTKGGLTDTEINAAWEQNKPNLNGVQLLESLESLGFTWRVANGVLHVATMQQQNATNATWFDLNATPATRIVALDATVTDAVAKAYMVASYMQDASDASGAEVHHAVGNAVIDWNTPPNDAQKGAFEQHIQYSTARFRNDANAERTDAVDAAFYRPFYSLLRTDANALILQRGSCTNAKLLLHDATTPLHRATVVHHAVALDANTYQTALHCNEVDAKNATTATLYQNVLQYFNPRATAFANRNYVLTIIYECELNSFINGNNPNFEQTIKYNDLTLFVDEVQVKPSTRIMTVSGRF